MRKIILFFKKPEIKYILILFLITRIVLSIIGTSSRMMLESFNVNTHNFNYHSNKFLSIWGVWDSSYYLNIAQNGYSTKLGQDLMNNNQANYVFFPLYPTLIKLTNFVVKDYYVAGLIISNLCLLLAAWFLYRLVKIDYNDGTAEKSIKYLFLFPTAFILSGVFNESLFLFLLIAIFYLARKEKWLLVGLAGFLLTITRPQGIIILLPIILEYLQSLNYKIKLINYKILYLLLWPIGLTTFLFYIQKLSGNFLNYFQIQKFGWHHELSNPLLVVVNGLTSKDIFQFLPITIYLALLLVILIKIKTLRPSYILLSILLFLFPLTSGLVAINSILRYILPIFPLFIALGALPKNKRQEDFLVISLALLQGFLMVFWTIGLHLIV